MARNGSGVYTKAVSSFSPGGTITASDHNSLWDDLVSEVTNSVAADGQTTMTGPLKAASGTAAAPSITFGSDTDSGFYLASANHVGGAVNGTKIIDVTTAGLTVTGTLNATAGVFEGGNYIIPLGSVFAFCGSSAPTNFLLCYGQAISRETYAGLFAVLSTTYGAGDGSTTFNLPDLRGRVVAGQDDMGGSSANRLTDQSGGLNGDTLGATGGAETHTLTEAQLAAHTHVQDAHSHTFAYSISTSNDVPSTGGNTRVTNVSITTATGTSVTTATTTATNQNTGGDAAHNNVQPTIILNYIIKAL